MTLTPGQHLGHYEILSHLAKGGMGEVYRARDTKLGREVAVKILKDERANDQGWLDRFEREARLLASFTHPNVATLHGLDEANGVRFLVMELVSGQTLAKRLERGGLPLPKALMVCGQIAEAIEAAHEKGIIHRDLKPGNVMITDQGQVKVLDFGLATNVEPAPAQVPVNCTTQAYEPRTAIGTFLGTAPYVSPEQARGEPVGKRCDTWAFGCILYETLCGKRAFPGKTHTDILAAVLERDPDWQALPPDTPRRVIGLIRRCLQKEQRDRQRDVGDARLEIEEILAERKDLAPAAKPALRRGRSLIALSVVLVAAAFALGTWFHTPQEKPPAAPRGWSAERLLGDPTRIWGARVSPDQRWLAFVVLEDGSAQVGKMNLDSGEWGVITHDRARGSVINVCWSDDSRHIYYDRHHVGKGGICSVSPGEQPRAKDRAAVIDDAGCPQVTNDGSLLVAKPNNKGNLELWRYWLDGNQEQRQVLDAPIQINTGDEVWWPFPLRPLHRKNQAVFCGKVLDGTKSVPQRRLYLLDLDTRKTQLLYPDPIPCDLVSLTVAPDDSYVYVVWPAGDLRQIVRIPLPGGGPAEPVLPLTDPVYGLDVDKQGRLFVDRFRRPPEILRFGSEGGAVERIGSLSAGQAFQPVELSDGRFLLPSRVSGRDRLLLKSPRKEPTFLTEHAETRTPATLLAQDRLAFVAVQDKGARLMSGRIKDDGVRDLKPLDHVPVEGLTALAASRDGKEIYYVRDRKVWAVPTAGLLPPRNLGEGDGVAVHPNGKELVVQRLEGQGVRLFRVQLPDGLPLEIAVKEGPVRLASDTISGQSIDKRGQMLVPTASPWSWYWLPALLDLETGKFEQPIPVEYEGDVYPANWGNDGKVIALGQPVKSDLWRFTPR